MPIDTYHVSLQPYHESYALLRRAYEGEQDIKSARETYLPKPSGFKHAEYETYLTKSFWFGATGRTVDGMVGFVFRKDPVVTASDLLKQHLMDVTLQGESVELLSQKLFQENWLMSRVGVLLDHNGERPYWIPYDTENIVNWRTSFIQGRERLEWVVLKETSHVSSVKDMFATEEHTQYRMLFMDKGQYHQQVFYKSSSGKLISAPPIVVTRKGQPLDFIPFYSVNGFGRSIHPSKSYMMDLVRANIKHYQLYADYLDSLWLVGQPMLWMAGFPKDTKVTMGSRQGFVTQNSEAKAGYLELQGQGLSPLRDELQRMEQLMVTLGSRLLEVASRGVEKPETLRIRRAGEDSILGRSAKIMDSNLSTILQVHAWWALETEQVDDKEYSVSVNKDYDDSKMDTRDAEALVRMWQSGAISYETMYHNLEAGEFIRPGVTAHDERELIELEDPAVLPQEDVEPRRQEDRDV